MQTADTTSIDELDNFYPTAHIDAQDEPYILPLREYLETHGVTVEVNTTEVSVPSYHIVVGDGVFVKQIFSRKDTGESKKLAIILESHKKHIDLPRGIQTIYRSPTPLSDGDVFTIFEFFFTEQQNNLDLRDPSETRTIHEQATIHEVEDTHMAHVDKSGDEHSRSDDTRVKSIIADVFGEDALPPSHGPQDKKRRHRKRMRTWIWGMVTLLGIIIIPIIWYVISIIVGGAAIAYGAKDLRAGNIGSVPWNTRVADYWTHQGKFVLTVATLPLSWVGGEDILRGQERLLSFMADTIQAENEAVSLTGIATRVASGLLNQVDTAGSGTMAASDISSLRISLYTLQNTLGLAQAQLAMLIKERTFPFTFASLSNKGVVAISDLADIRESTADMDKLLSLFLSLAGFKEPRTYLILLQNSMELRPTGGFIGSVAIASFADGRLTNLDIQDVYTFDGQLKGHVDPPTPVKELLSQEHWYLRDSNWDPDFKEAGSRAAWFYEKEAGTAVDGVVAISTPFIIELLRATGPVELSDYNDRISADNFYGKSLYYTQNDFFPGSTQKKDFLGSLSRAMLSSITSGKNVNTPKLFRAITTALTAHNIIMMFGNPDVQTLVQLYGWAGRVPGQFGCSGVDPTLCTFDPMITVEANMGVNKVNYFVTRSIERRLTVNSDGTRDVAAEIAIKNSSGSQDKNMPYLTYIRFVLPKNSSVTKISVDGTEIKTRTTTQPVPVPYMESAMTASGLFTVGIAFDVVPATEKHVTISYRENTPLSFGRGGAVLDVYTQKQPGVSDTPVHTVIAYPSEWTAGIEEDGAPGPAQDFIAKQGQLEYNTILTRDDLTRIRFTKP